MTDEGVEQVHDAWIRGKCLAWDERRDEDAMDEFERAVLAATEAGTPEVLELGVEATVSRAWHLWRLGRDDEAWDAAEAASRLTHVAETPEAYEQCAWDSEFQSLVRLVRGGDGDLEAALEASTRAVEAGQRAGTTTGDRSARHGLLDAGRVLLELGRPAEAVEYVERTVDRTTSGHPHARDYLAPRRCAPRSSAPSRTATARPGRSRASGRDRPGADRRGGGLKLHGPARTATYCGTASQLRETVRRY